MSNQDIDPKDLEKSDNEFSDLDLYQLVKSCFELAKKNEKSIKELKAYYLKNKKSEVSKLMKKIDKELESIGEVNEDE